MAQSKEERAAKAKARYHANPERFRAKTKAFRENHKESVNSKKKAYRAENRDKCNAQSRALRAANLEEYRARGRADYIKNREKEIAETKAWYRANKADKLAYNKRYNAANRDKIRAQRAVYLAVYNVENRAEILEKQKARRRSDPDGHRAAERKSHYGLAQEEFDRMVSDQNGVCAICGVEKPGQLDRKHLYVDHCHRTGFVRGLLCHRCNIRLGPLDKPDWLAAAMRYLDTASPTGSWVYL